MRMGRWKGPEQEGTSVANLELVNTNILRAELQILQNPCGDPVSWLCAHVQERFNDPGYRLWESERGEMAATSELQPEG